MALADDYAGLDELAGKGKGKQPKARRLRTLEEREGASIVEQLREIMAVHFQRVATVLRQWDEDGNGTVDRREVCRAPPRSWLRARAATHPSLPPPAHARACPPLAAPGPTPLPLAVAENPSRGAKLARRQFCRALPVLGLAVPAEAAGALFDSLDTDGSGALDYEEMHKELRAGVGVELDEVLRVGGAGEIAVEARNAAALRGGKLDKDSSKIFGKAAMLDASSGVPILQQLQRALASPGVLARVIDIFRAWDEDGSGTVSRFEFARALPVLGLRVERAQAESLFDSIDEDGSGSVEYAELHRKLRRHGASGAASTSSLPTIQQRRGHSVAASPSVASAPAIGYSAVRRAVAEELEARRELTRLQRQLRLADRQSALQAAQQKRRAENVAFKAAMDARVGRDLNAVIADISPATDAQMVDMANAIYGALAGGERRTRCARMRARMRPYAACTHAHDARPRAHDAREQHASHASHACLRFIASHECCAHWLSVGCAWAVCLCCLIRGCALWGSALCGCALWGSALCGSALCGCALWGCALCGGGLAASWYVLFKEIDEDSSGRISYAELRKAIRQRLGLSASAMPESELRAVWRALDEDASGYISAGGAPDAHTRMPAPMRMPPPTHMPARTPTHPAAQSTAAPPRPAQVAFCLRAGRVCVADRVWAVHAQGHRGERRQPHAPRRGEGSGGGDATR